MFGLVPYQLASAYSLSVIPLFILMGAVAARGKMAAELFQACNAVFSGIRGALANATIGACALFGAISGSSIATAATFSQVAIPEMRRHGYDPAFAAGAVWWPRYCRGGNRPNCRSSDRQNVLNLRAAKRLGMEIPTSILLRADEVIE